MLHCDVCETFEKIAPCCRFSFVCMYTSTRFTTCVRWVSVWCIEFALFHVFISRFPVLQKPPRPAHAVLHRDAGEGPGLPLPGERVSQGSGVWGPDGGQGSGSGQGERGLCCVGLGWRSGSGVKGQGSWSTSTRRTVEHRLCVFRVRVGFMGIGDQGQVLGLWVDEVR